MLREARPVVMRLAVVVQDVYALARAWNDHTNGHEISDNIMNTHDIQNLTPVHIRELADQWLHEALTNANTFFLRIAGERQGIQDADALAQRQESLSKIAKATRERIALNQVEYLSDRAVQLMVQAGGMNVTDAEALRKTDAFRLLCQEFTLLFTDMHERATRLRAGKQDFRQLCAPVSKWFTLFRRARGIGAEEGEKSNQVFHSFRHTLVTYLHKEARIDLSMIKAVVGHVEGQEMGITAQYAGEWPVVTLRDEVILKLNWHERFPFLARLAW